MERELPEGTPGAITTTFRVEPAGAGCAVTISSAWEKRGLAAFVDRWVAVPLMRRIYAKELVLVAEVARRDVASADPARPRASVQP